VVKDFSVIPLLGTIIGIRKKRVIIETRDNRNTNILQENNPKSSPDNRTPVPEPRNIPIPSKANEFVLFSEGRRSMIIELERGKRAPKPTAESIREKKKVMMFKEIQVRKSPRE
jgi:hypothetical protein